MTENNPFEFGASTKARFKLCGNQAEIMTSTYRSRGGTTRKLDNDNYLDIRSGEVKKFNHIENRQQDIVNVAKTISKLRDIINTNCVDANKIRWLTLTYAENMRDTKKLMNDYEAFVRKARNKYGKFEYIAVAEPQGRGAWHLHCLLIFEADAPFMENKIIAEAWGNGFVNIQARKDIDNIGLYFSMYLCNMELDQVKQNKIPYTSDMIENKIVNGENKMFVKGARLHFYPTKFNIYRCSKGIKKPNIEYMTYSEAKKKIGSAKPIYKKEFDIPFNDKSNTISYEYYNLNRNEKQ